MTTSILEELRKLDNALPITVLESVLNKPSRWRKESERPTYLALSLGLVKGLGQIDQAWATRSNGRHAVFHPLDEVRDAAADSLSDLPMGTYVTQLLTWMQSPVEVILSVNQYPHGNTVFHQTFYREGLEADFREGRTDWVHRVNPKGPKLVAPGSMASISARERLNSRLDWSDSVRSAQETRVDVQNANAATLQRNWRVRHALHRATGVDCGDNACDWHEWWCDHYELCTPTREG